MEFYSTKQKNKLVSCRNTILKGIPDDGGLFMPVSIPKMPPEFFNRMGSLSFQEISFEIAKNLLHDAIPHKILKDIITDALNFDAPIFQLDDNIFVLELFHGPTLAFKDFAARFMARTMSFFVDDTDTKLNVLVATSGDTGSAVAHGFHNTPGIRVIILYPSKKISGIQEKQITTLGGNVIALEVEGTFDDCQALVKRAFLDPELSNKLWLTSANSINIARLIPQSFYYFYAYAQLKDKESPVVFSVPSGNLGNLTGGLFAKMMGLPVSKFIAANNVNNTFYKYLKTGTFKPQAAIKTISNAMDVGNPSNFARILDLYNNSVEKMRNDIYSASFSDNQTKNAIREVYNKYNYILDPHSAVGYMGLKQYFSEVKFQGKGIFCATAHPAKFSSIVEEIIGRKVEIPPRLKKYLDRERKSILISNDFEDFKDFLLTLSN
jgi:threonine synthase